MVKLFGNSLSVYSTLNSSASSQLPNRTLRSPPARRNQVQTSDCWKLFNYSQPRHLSYLHCFLKSAQLSFSDSNQTSSTWLGFSLTDGKDRDFNTFQTNAWRCKLSSRIFSSRIFSIISNTICYSAIDNMVGLENINIYYTYLDKSYGETYIVALDTQIINRVRHAAFPLK